MLRPIRQRRRGALAVLAAFTLCAMLTSCAGHRTEYRCLTLQDEGRVEWRRDFEFDPIRSFDLDAIVGKSTLHTGDSITRFTLYAIPGPDDSLCPEAVARIDWSSPDTSDSVIGRACALHEGDDYTFDPVRFHVLIRKDFYSATDIYSTHSAALAFYMVIDTGGGTVEFGHIPDSPNGGQYELQLLCRSVFHPSPDDPVRAGEWKNVYVLAYRIVGGISANCSVEILRADWDKERISAHRSRQRGTPYVQLLGLDREGHGGRPRPDGCVDNDSAILDSANGLLVFPKRNPFADSALSEPVPGIYATTEQSRLNSLSKYYILATSARRFPLIRLPKFDIREGSEIVTLNGQSLNRGIDYEFDYSAGTVTFLREDALDPAADVRICFEYER